LKFWLYKLGLWLVAKQIPGPEGDAELLAEVLSVWEFPREDWVDFTLPAPNVNEF